MTKTPHLHNLDRVHQDVPGQPLYPLLEGGAEQTALTVGPGLIAEDLPEALPRVFANLGVT